MKAKLLSFKTVYHLLNDTVRAYILENVATSELVETGVAEFLFVLSVPKRHGATAALAAPLAVI